MTNKLGSSIKSLPPPSQPHNRLRFTSIYNWQDSNSSERIPHLEAISNSTTNGDLMDCQIFSRNVFQCIKVWSLFIYVLIHVIRIHFHCLVNKKPNRNQKQRRSNSIGQFGKRPFFLIMRTCLAIRLFFISYVHTSKKQRAKPERETWRYIKAEFDITISWWEY